MPFKDKDSLPAKQSRARRNAKYYRKFKAELLEKRRPVRRKYYEEHKVKWKYSAADVRRRLYGIDEEAFNKMLENQDNKCAICGSNNMDEKRGLCVDHDHKTGIVRGLLCDRCNRGLGNFKDDIPLLQKVITYLNS